MFYTRYRIFTYYSGYVHCFDCGIVVVRMAEEVDAIVANETNDTVETSGRDAATTEGLLLAYGSLLVMALIPIYLGARRSVHFHDNLKVIISFGFYNKTIVIIRAYPERLLP